MEDTDGEVCAAIDVKIERLYTRELRRLVSIKMTNENFRLPWVQAIPVEHVERWGSNYPFNTMPCTVRRHWVRLRPSMDGYVCDGPWNPVGPVTMTEAIERLQQATSRVALLVKEHEQLRQRHARAEEDLGTQRRTNEVLSKRVTELEQENEVLRTVQSKQKDVPPQAKERIDELVSEIDRCLALISA